MLSGALPSHLLESRLGDFHHIARLQREELEPEDDGWGPPIGEIRTSHL